MKYKDVIIISVGMILLFTCGILIFNLSKSKAYSKDLEEQIKTVIQKEKDYNNGLINLNNLTIAKHNKVVDSLSSIINEVEVKRKKEYYRYEKELDKLKGIKTYTQRVTYLDSLDAFLSNH